MIDNLLDWGNHRECEGRNDLGNEFLLGDIWIPDGVGVNR